MNYWVAVAQSTRGRTNWTKRISFRKEYLSFLCNTPFYVFLRLFYLSETSFLFYASRVNSKKADGENCIEHHTKVESTVAVFVTVQQWHCAQIWTSSTSRNQPVRPAAITGRWAEIKAGRWISFPSKAKRSRRGERTILILLRIMYTIRCP